MMVFDEWSLSQTLSQLMNLSLSFLFSVQFAEASEWLALVGAWHQANINLLQQPLQVHEPPSLEVFEMWLERMLENGTEAAFPTKGWARWSFKVPSNLGCSMTVRYKNRKKKIKEHTQNIVSTANKQPVMVLKWHYWLN